MPAFLRRRRNLAIIGLAIVAILIAVGAFLLLPKGKTSTKNTTNNQFSTQSANQASSETTNTTQEDISWQWTGSEWTSSGSPPSCSTPLFTGLPVDLNKVTAILYPGQTRGGNYKAHGGFHFENDNAVNVLVPLDANVTEGSHYIEGGEVQYMFTFISSCGIAYRFDHLHTLSEKFQALANQLPAAKVDDSRTTPFDPPAKVLKGEVVATKVGFVNTQNVSVDFGVYDLRNPNSASRNAAFAQAHEDSKQFVFYGICWLKELPSELSQKVLALPGSGTEGKTSDYC